MKKIEATKICWNITENCNRNCKHCFRFLNSPDLSYEECVKVLNILNENGVKNITWTGGEATLFPNIELLINKASSLKIKNNLITNGTTLTNDIFKEKYSCLDSITFSLDFIDNLDNINFGRGDNYYNHIKELITYINTYYPNIGVKINTVILRDNKDKLEDIYNAIKDFKILKWKLIKFVSFRGTAYDNKDIYATTSDEFTRKVDNILLINNNLIPIEIVKTSDLEEGHTMIKPNGDLVVTVQGIDKLLFNILKEGE